ALREIALRVHDDAARDRAVRAGVAGFGGAGQFEWPDGCRKSGLEIAEAERSERRTRKTRASADQEAAPRELHVHGVCLLRGLAPAGGRPLLDAHVVVRFKETSSNAKKAIFAPDQCQ